MPLNGKLGSSSRGTPRNAESMGKNFTTEYKSSAPKDRPSGAQDGNALKALARKKAEAAMQTPKRSAGGPLRGRPAGTVDTDMGMSNPKRPSGTFRMN